MVRTRILAELERRMALFPHEVLRLEAAARADDRGLGIHASQVSVLKILMDELLQRQHDFLARLQQTLSDAEFADGASALLFEEMSGAQRIWSVFSRAFADRQRVETAVDLDTADLVAADCYLLCTGRARNWGVLDADGLREPPLVCLEAYPEAIAVGRHDPLGSLCDAGWRFHDLRLPIPLVLLPADQIGCVWLLPPLCHEVGHDVDKDLGLSAELTSALAGADGGIAPARRQAWQRWTAEILADVFGVLLGNVGFARAVAALLLLLAFGRRCVELDVLVSHPHPLLRLHLVASMLRRLGLPALVEAAAQLEDEARTVPAPDGIAPYLEDVDAVTSVFLATRLRGLGGHSLSELNPELAADVKRAQLLAEYLASGALRPSPDQPARFPYRLVPAAAQLAVTAASRGTAAQLAAVQQRATEFVAAIPRPPFLEGGARLTSRRAAFLARLAREMKLGKGS